MNIHEIEQTKPLVPTKSNTKAAWIAPVVTALIGGATSIYNNYQQKKAAEEEREYNAPVNQMKRFAEAGINPYEVANRGENTAHNFVPSQIDPSPLGEVISNVAQMQQLKNNMMQYKQQEEAWRGAQLDNQYKAMTLKDRAYTIGLKLNILNLDAQLKAGAITKQEYDNQLKQIEVAYSHWFNTPDDTGFSLRQKMANTAYDKESQAVDNMEAQENLINAQKTHLGVQDSYIEKQKDYLDVKTDREQIARDFEELWNRPFNSADLVDGLITQALQVAQGYFKLSPKERKKAGGFWKYTLSRFDF